MHVTDFDAPGYLIDLDGTLISAGAALPDAARLLKRVAGRFRIVSNNAEHTPRQLAGLLRSLDLPVAEELIILAGTAAIDIVAHQYPGASVLLLGSPALAAYARAKGLCVNTNAPDLVLVMRDRRFNYRRLAAASEAIFAGAGLVIAAPDGSHPGLNGCPVPETGAIAAAILACTGLKTYTVIGKPEKTLFELGCLDLGVNPSQAVMIGDNPDTDGLGAARAGMRFIRVKQGRIDWPKPADTRELVN